MPLRVKIHSRKVKVWSRGGDGSDFESVLETLGVALKHHGDRRLSVRQGSLFPMASAGMIYGRA